MRYTTIIDISSLPIYKNKNAVLIYLHLCLRANYSDEERDKCNISIRQLALQTDTTISAVRNALKQLLKYKLIRYVNGDMYVVKFLVNPTYTPRLKTQKQIKENEVKKLENDMKIEKERKAENDKLNEEKKLQAALKRGTTPLLDYINSVVKPKAEEGDKDYIRAWNRYIKSGIYESELRKVQEYKLKHNIREEI